jgi:hypothetical protein
VGEKEPSDPDQALKVRPENADLGDEIENGDRAMKTYLCVVDVLPSGRIAAIEVTAEDALTAERSAQETGRERFGGPVEVLEVLRTDVTVPAA